MCKQELVKSRLRVNAWNVSVCWLRSCSLVLGCINSASTSHDSNRRPFVVVCTCFKFAESVQNSYGMHLVALPACMKCLWPTIWQLV